MARTVNPESRERVLNMAERLFNERGYKAVSMRDIANALGIKQASLYYHIPEGKEQLFVEVMTRSFVRHGDGLRCNIESVENSLRPELKAIARWFIAHAPLGLLGMMQNDLLELEEKSRLHLNGALIQHVWSPIQSVFECAVVRGEAEKLRAFDLTGAFLSMMDGLTHAGVHGLIPGGMQGSADYMIDTLMDGLLAKSDC